MYVELHARSAFSFLEGASTPEDLMTAAARLNLPAMAILDRDGVYGGLRAFTWPPGKPVCALTSGLRSPASTAFAIRFWPKRAPGTKIFAV